MHGNTKHGMKGTRIYSIWTGMKTRCLNKNHTWFKHYGGRGIKVCEKWLNFVGFYEDMRKNYSKDLTLDRIDPSGNYCKENCRWATKLQQSNNARNNIIIEYNGEKKSLKEWSEIKKISYFTLYSRLFGFNWKIEDLFLPKGYTQRLPRKKTSRR